MQTTPHTPTIYSSRSCGPTKHRESKWAKGIKATGRAAWDQDALDGVTEMARRNEELRRRFEGMTIRDENEMH
jgi:U3 small nucleolar RNA-associated protein 14